MKSYKNYINGTWIAHTSEKIDVIDPYTENVIATVVNSSEKDLNEAVLAASNAFEDWKNRTPAERSLLFLKLADLISRDREKIAALESQNQGKTLATALADIDFAIDNLRFFAGACRTLSVTVPGEYVDTLKKKKHSPQGTSILRREPIGVVAAITPWNYPFMIACWKLAALAVGNTMIMKPSSYTPLTTFILAELATEAGFPKGVLNIITGEGRRLGAMIAEHPNIDMLSLTGSTETGKEIMCRASTTLKKVHLELGGKAPFIVWADADIDRAAKYAVDASIINGGQDCTSAERIYVHKEIYSSFLNKLKKYASTITVGDPSKPGTKLGPLVSAVQQERVSSFLKKLQGDEKVIFQSKVPKKGFFFPVTIVKNLEQKGNLCQNEVFGPIISVAAFSSDSEVIEKANDVEYGLASSIWTKDINRAFKLSRELKFGEVWINDHLPLVSEMPHGGLKQSGHGADLSIYALEEYTYLKHVYVGLS